MSFKYSVDEMALGTIWQPKGKMLQNGGKGYLGCWRGCQPGTSVLEGVVGGEAASKGPETEVMGGH